MFYVENDPLAVPKTPKKCVLACCGAPPGLVVGCIPRPSAPLPMEKVAADCASANGVPSSMGRIRAYIELSASFATALGVDADNASSFADAF